MHANINVDKAQTQADKGDKWPETSLGVEREFDQPEKAYSGSEQEKKGPDRRNGLCF